MKAHILLLFLVSCSLYTQEDIEKTPPNTAQSIFEIVKDVFGWSRAKLRSTLKTGGYFFQRARKEAGYFGQELQSFIRTEQEILAKKTLDEIAQSYSAVQVSLTLDALTQETIEHLVACSKPIDLIQLQNELMKLNPHIPAEITVQFVPQIRILTQQQHIPSSSLSSCTLIFRITRPKETYQWRNIIEQYLHFSHSISFIKDRSEYYAALLDLVHTAYDNKTLVDIIISY